MRLDDIEEFAKDITDKEGLNISAEKVTGGYAILIGPVGQPRAHYKTMPREESLAFLDGVLAGVTMLQAEMEAAEDQYDFPEIDEDEEGELPQHVLDAAAKAARCPDCLSSTTEPVKTPHGTWYMEVRHDPSCPAMNQWIRDHKDE